MSQSQIHYNVQKFLERSAPLFKYLKNRNVLSDEEIRQIAESRKQKEYKVRTLPQGERIPVFLTYLKQEQNFLAFILAKVKAEGLELGTEQKLDALKFVDSLWHRAIKQNQTGRMWYSYLEFCIRHDLQVEKQIESALFHMPTFADLWLISAQYMFEVRDDVKASRGLLERGISMIKDDIRLWLSLFHMECRVALPNVDEIVEKYEKEEDILTDTKDMYATPLLVMEEILKQFPHDFDARFKLLDILISYPETERIQNDLIRGMLRDFMHEEECVFRCLLFPLKHSFTIETKEKVLSNLSKLTPLINSKSWWELKSQYCVDLIDSDEELSEKDRLQFLRILLNDIYLQAASQNKMTSSMWLKYGKIIWSFDRTDALNIFKQGLTEYPDNDKLAIIYVQSLVASGMLSESIKIIEKLSRMNLQSKLFCDFLIHFFMEHRDQSDILECFKSVIRVQNLSIYKEKFLRWAILEGKDVLQNAISFISKVSPTHIETFKLLIMYYLHVGEKKDAYATYESALREHGKHDANLWHEYIKRLDQDQEIKKRHQVIQRAQHELENPDQLMLLLSNDE